MQTPGQGPRPLLEDLVPAYLSPTPARLNLLPRPQGRSTLCLHHSTSPHLFSRLTVLIPREASGFTHLPSGTSSPPCGVRYHCRVLGSHSTACFSVFSSYSQNAQCSFCSSVSSCRHLKIRDWVIFFILWHVTQSTAYSRCSINAC